MEIQIEKLMSARVDLSLCIRKMWTHQAWTDELTALWLRLRTLQELKLALTRVLHLDVQRRIAYDKEGQLAAAQEQLSHELTWRLAYTNKVANSVLDEMCEPIPRRAA